MNHLIRMGESWVGKTMQREQFPPESGYHLHMVGWGNPLFNVIDACLNILAAPPPPVKSLKKKRTTKEKQPQFQNIG